jgi:tetratricopeptide (TPR) repeat protein
MKWSWIGPAFALLFLLSCAAPRQTEPVFTDPALDRLTRSARGAFDQGNASRAVELYAQALERARVLDHPAHIGNAAYNLAVSLIMAGEYEPAVQRLHEAETALRRAGENLADVLLVRARLALLRGDTEQALRLADAVFTRPGSKPETVHEIQVALLRGSIAVQAGDSSAAQAALHTAAQAMNRAHEPALHAGFEDLRGQVALLNQRPLLAAEAFDRAADSWRWAGHWRNLARALASAGAAYQTAGQNALAADRFFRGARSSLAQGEETNARAWLAQAAELAEQAGDNRLQRRVRDLDGELEASGGPGE